MSIFSRISLKHLNKWLLALLTILLISSFLHLVKVHAQTESITYSGGVITVTGFTEGSPCTFWDVWNASTVNGWNVAFLNEFNSTQYAFNCTLRIGDGSTETWFHDRSVQVLWFSDSVVYDALTVKANAHFILGDVVSESDKATQNSSSIMLHNFWNIYCDGGEMSFYDVSIHCLDPSPDWTWIGYDASTIQSRIWNCRFNKVYDFSFYSGSNVSLSNVEVIDAENPHEIFESINLENVVFRNSNHELFFFDFPGTITINDLVGSNATDETFCFYNQPNIVYLVNPDIDAWTFNFKFSTGKAYRQYTFDLTLTYPNGTPFENANVTIMYEGQGGGTVGSWLTNSTGQITTQTLSRSFYNQTGGNTEYAYYPYNITVTADGYDTYTKKWTPTEKTTWEIALRQPSGKTSGWIISGTFAIGLPILAFMLIFTAFILRRKR